VLPDAAVRNGRSGLVNPTASIMASQRRICLSFTLRGEEGNMNACHHSAGMIDLKQTCHVGLEYRKVLSLAIAMPET
jgi:hypothetical protein